MLEMENTHRKINWFPEELKAWKPPEDLLVSEWADEKRIMDIKSSATPGKWRNEMTPYLVEIMNQMNNPLTQIITLACGSQLGKSETLNNVQAYIIDQDPSPILVVYPSDKLAESVSKNRIIPMLKAIPSVAAKFKERESQKLELQFEGMYIALTGATPSNLSSRPVRVVIIDETDKLPGATVKEADPVSLAIERTKTFKYDKKIFLASTPTLMTGQIWSYLMRSDVIKQYYVPCPHCGEHQTLKMKQIKWPKELNKLPVDEQIRKVERVAFYACEHCGQHIEDRHKGQMLLKGEWRPVKYTKEGQWIPSELPEEPAKKIGYQLSTLYSPWATFGEVAAKFIEAKQFPDELRNFVNSWLGEPWRDTGTTMQSDIVCTYNAVGRSFKVFVDGAYWTTATYRSSEGEKYISSFEIYFSDHKKHVITLVLTEIKLSIDYIDVVPPNQQVITNSVATTYPSIEVESVDTVSRFSPLGKVAGDTSHSVKIKYGAARNTSDILPTSGNEFSQNGYSYVGFLNGIKTEFTFTTTSSDFVFAIIEYNLLADQSPYKALSPIELQNVLSLWVARL